MTWVEVLITWTCGASVVLTFGAAYHRREVEKLTLMVKEGHETQRALLESLRAAMNGAPDKDDLRLINEAHMAIREHDRKWKDD